jgi:hypothetical protein
VDRKAKALRVSRNQLVVRALEREVRDGSDWSPGFFAAVPCNETSYLQLLRNGIRRPLFGLRWFKSRARTTEIELHDLRG